jgi:hypothetical protein
VTERERLNIPEGVERLNLHDSKLFMCACGFSKGGYARGVPAGCTASFRCGYSPGVRFSSCEIGAVSRLVTQLTTEFVALDKQFAALPAQAKKVGLCSVEPVSST